MFRIWSGVVTTSSLLACPGPDLPRQFSDTPPANHQSDRVSTPLPIETGLHPSWSCTLLVMS